MNVNFDLEKLNSLSSEELVDLQVESYFKAYHTDSNRRESLIRLAETYLYHKNYRAAVSFASASLTIPFDGYYANSKEHYEDVPHSILYQAYGWLGQIDKAQEHITKALEYQPYNSTYLRDLRYYYSLPKVDIIIPTIHTRPEGLRKCIESIYRLNYPQELINIVLEEGPEVLSVKMKMAVDRTTGDYIAFAADDTEFTPDSLILNVWDSMTSKKGLVAFDTGVRNEEGYINEHFLIKRDLLPEIGGEVFCTKLKHYCVDDLLWKKCLKINQSMIGKGVMLHHHWSRQGSGIQPDETNLKSMEYIPSDREILKEELAKLNLQ